MAEADFTTAPFVLSLLNPQQKQPAARMFLVQFLDESVFGSIPEGEIRQRP